MKNLYALAIPMFVICCACTPTKTITYETDDIFTVSDSMRTEAEISIQPFEDKRRTVDDTQVLFTGKRISKIDDEKICFNSEKNYETEKISQQLTSMLHDHFEAAKAFGDVHVSKSDGNYKLTGDIVRLFGRQEFSNKVAVGSQFGLIGVLATSGVKTEGTFRITLSNLQLRDMKSNSTYPLKDIDLQFEGEYSVDADCWSVYNHVSEKLKQSIDQRLIPAIVTTIQL